jgi:hypothetical protein
MTTKNPTTANPEVTVSRDEPEVLREEIEQTRTELGDTVEALAAKADVKARVRDKAEQMKEQARARRTQAVQKWQWSRASAAPQRPAIAVGSLSVLVSIVALVLSRRRWTKRPRRMRRR